MLSQSDINPFDSQEAKPYKSDPEILAMTELREAYQNNDIDQFERILRWDTKNVLNILTQYFKKYLGNIFGTAL